MSGQEFFPMMDESLHYIGTNANAGGDFSAMQLDQDVNATLDDATFDDEFLYNTSFSPYAMPAIIQSMADDIVPIKRVDSGLNARARSFIPQQSWQQELKPVARTNTLRQLQLLTPIKTDMEASWQSAPHSAPPLDYCQDNSAVSPLFTFTDDTRLPAQGCQWSWPGQTAQDFNAWAGSSSFSAGALGPNYVNPALLTPTSQCGSTISRSRSASVASATTYSCEYPGCPKSFKTKAEFSHHRRNHGERKHDCESCHKKFVFRKDLTRHIKTHNPDDRDYFCSVPGCVYVERGFQRKDHHDRHMKTHEAKGECPLTPRTSSASLSRTPSYR